MNPTAPTVTVVIPTIPPREDLLKRALASAQQQTYPLNQILAVVDEERLGSAANRNRSLEYINSDFVLWLDDDDQLMPHCVQLMIEAHLATNADIISGSAWVPQNPAHIEPISVPPGWIDPKIVMSRSHLTVTSLMRADLVKKVGGFEFREDPSGMMLDDYGLYYKLAEAGATFYRIPDHTFIWNHHGKNTSGNPNNW